MTIFTAQFTWLPQRFGGHSSPPWVGMRAGFIPLKKLDEAEKLLPEVTCIELRSEDTDRDWNGVFSSSSIPSHWLKTDAPFELKSGYRVIAVGIVTQTPETT